MRVAVQTGLDVRVEAGRTIVTPRGDWTATNVPAFDAQMRAIEKDATPGRVAIDLSQLGRIDTSGAYVISRVLSMDGAPQAPDALIGDHHVARQLIELVYGKVTPTAPEPPPGPGVLVTLDRAGRALHSAWIALLTTLGFLGETMAAGVRGLGRPDRIRWAPVFHVMEQAGLNALPIVATLSFFVGAVVAYIGANILSQFGADVFAVELVVIAVLREFSVVITAILLAGRSDSAFTAQIGSMRMQQEIDAMRVIGLDPIEALVLPRVLACVVMTPLLVFGSMMMGIFGGMVVLWSSLDISPGYFIVRMRDLPIQHFWVGMVKAPVFALVIAVIGCRHGLEVGGDVESLGNRVTASVVQSIFAVIVIDAIFAMIYMELNI